MVRAGDFLVCRSGTKSWGHRVVEKKQAGFGDKLYLGKYEVVTWVSGGIID